MKGYKFCLMFVKKLSCKNLFGEIFMHTHSNILSLRTRVTLNRSIKVDYLPISGFAAQDADFTSYCLDQFILVFQGISRGIDRFADMNIHLLIKEEFPGLGR